jgi:DtxR family transcriptional regulator, Mn-dependent transcriptional regulator
MMAGIEYKNKPTPSLEDYLKALAIIKEQGRRATVTALSELTGVTTPSVSEAVTRLSEAGLVFHEKYRDVELTAEGARIAADIYHRHKTLRHFLADVLNVDAKTADTDACRAEHVFSRSSLLRLEKLSDFVLSCPRNNSEWLKNFNYYVEHGQRDTRQMVGCLEQKPVKQ